jgi:hypothetical protein
MPMSLRDIAYQNKRVVYNLLMKAETTLAIAADPKASVHGSASPQCFTPGARHSPTIRTCTAYCIERGTMALEQTTDRLGKVYRRAAAFDRLALARGGGDGGRPTVA